MPKFGSDKLFAWLTGTGVTTGASLALLANSASTAVPIPGVVLVVLALGTALPLSSLRLRGNSVEWLGSRLTAAATGAVLLGLLFSYLIVLGFWRTAEYRVDLIAAFVFLAGLLSGWFAFDLKRWAEGHPTVTPGKSRWDPRFWGAPGLAGVTIVVLSSAVLVGLASSSFPAYGPTGVEAFYTEVFTVLLLVLGVVSLGSEIATWWDARGADLGR